MFSFEKVAILNKGPTMLEKLNRCLNRVTDSQLQNGSKEKELEILEKLRKVGYLDEGSCFGKLLGSELYSFLWEDFGALFFFFGGGCTQILLGATWGSSKNPGNHKSVLQSFTLNLSG